MRKVIFIAVLLFIISAPIHVHAIDLGADLARDAATQGGFDPGTSETTFAETLGTIVRAALSFVGIIFTALMVYAGYLWMTARGDESKVEKSQNIIKAAIIGLVITVGAYSITSFVVPRIIERTTGGAGGSARQQSGGGQTGLCDWGTGNSPNATRTFCADQCRIAARNSVDCRYNGTAAGTAADPQCTWNSGSMALATGADNAQRQQSCFNQCVTVGRSRTTCRFEGAALVF